MKGPPRRKCSRNIKSFYMNFMPFLRTPIFSPSIMCNENVSGGLNCSKIGGVYMSKWHCVWVGTDNGNLVVNTECGQKEKSTCETLLKGSVTGKAYEAAFNRLVRAASKVLCIRSLKKKILQAKDFKCSKTHWWKTMTLLNELNIPGIQSHPISQEKILVQY